MAGQNSTRNSFYRFIARAGVFAGAALLSVTALANLTISTSPQAGVTLVAGEPGVAGSVSTPGAAGNNAVSSNAGDLTIPRTGRANVGASGSSFTIEMWIRPSANLSANNRTTGFFGAGSNYSGTNRNIIWDADDYTRARGFIVGLAQGAVYFSVNAQGQRTIVGTTDLRDGHWHHIAVTRSDGAMAVFVDGVREASFAGPGGNVDYAGSGAQYDQHLRVIAKEKLNWAGGYAGDISVIRISDSVRYSGSAYAIPTVFSSDANTAGLYLFDEGAGSTASDSSGNGSPASLRGNPAPSWSQENAFQE